jgi:hypothetical protein
VDFAAPHSSSGGHRSERYALGVPDLLIFWRRCFFPAFLTFLAALVFFLSRGGIISPVTADPA